MTIPERRPWASVSSTASTRLAAIRRHASDTVVPSGIVNALDRRSFFTVLSPLPKETSKNQIFAGPGSNRGDEMELWKQISGRGSLRAYVSWWGEAGLEATFPFPFPLAAAAVAEGSSDLREEAEGGRLRVRRLGAAAEAAALMARLRAGARADS